MEPFLKELEGKVKKNQCTVLLMMNRAFPDYKEKQFLTTEEMTHYCSKIQLYTLSIVAHVKGNAGSSKRISVLTEHNGFSRKSMEWVLQDSFCFFEKCLTNELENVDFYIVKK